MKKYKNGINQIQNVSDDLSQFNNNINEIDLLSIKSEANFIDNNNNNSNRSVSQNIIHLKETNLIANKSELNYVFDFKDDCNLTIINNDPNFKPNLCYYQTTFDKYMKDTEDFLKLKYKSDKLKLSNVPFKIHKLKVRMLVKLITEEFDDISDIILNNRFGKDFNDSQVKKKICYVIRLAIPNIHREYLKNIITSKKNENDCSDKFEIKQLNIEEEFLINKKINTGNCFDITLEKLKPEIFSDFNSQSLIYTSEDYQKLLDDTFMDVINYNVKLYKIFKEVISKTNFNYLSFIRTLCIFIRFAKELHSKIKIIGNEIHLELFCDEFTYLKKAEDVNYCFKMSNSGKRKLGDFKSSNGNNIVDIESGIKSIELLQNEKLSQELIHFYTKNMYIPYTANSFSFFKLYNIENDLQINEDILFDVNKMSILRNVDRVRLLQISINNCLNFKNLKNSNLLIDFVIKRDTTIYKQKSSNFVWSNLNICSSNSIKPTIKRFRNTYGENLSYYFSWTYHLLEWVMYLILLILILLTLQFFLISSPPVNKIKLLIYGVPVRKTIDYSFSIIFILWLSLYIRSWKRKEKVLSIQWGTYDQEDTFEKDREQYECENHIRIFSNKISRKWVSKYIISILTSFFITLIMIVFTSTLLMWFQDIQTLHHIEKKGKELYSLINSNNVNKIDIYYYWLPFLIGLFIKIMTYVYDCICIKLTDGENHQKESSYRRSYMFKRTVFNIFNNYFSFYYIIFIKSQMKTCPTRSCIIFLSDQLFKIFISYYLISIFQMVLPLFNKYIDRIILNGVIKEFHSELSEDELKHIKINFHKKYSYLLLPKYSKKDLMREYHEVILLLGFISQFGIINPVMFFLFAFYVYLRRLIDSAKISHYYNINLFNFTEKIGIFNHIIKFILIISTFMNLYVAFFINGIDEKLLNIGDHWYYFIIVRNLFLILIFLLNLNIFPDWTRYYASIKEDFIKMKKSYMKEKTFLSETK